MAPPKHLKAIPSKLNPEESVLPSSLCSFPPEAIGLTRVFFIPLDPGEVLERIGFGENEAHFPP